MTAVPPGCRAQSNEDAVRLRWLVWALKEGRREAKRAGTVGAKMEGSFREIMGRKPGVFEGVGC